jgi:hypothetical protein
MAAKARAGKGVAGWFFEKTNEAAVETGAVFEPQGTAGAPDKDRRFAGAATALSGGMTMLTAGAAGGASLCVACQIKRRRSEQPELRHA